jgi:hypothetical protein
MWAGLSPFCGPTETGLSDMIVRQSGRDHSPFKAHELCEERLADFETIRDDFVSLDDWEAWNVSVPP